ncbi:MAG: hypothetical protein M3Z05_21635 [Gemmatimonadota bacterium]|nr:hypothetical protein [Gemmatimonadota bacterium]
MKYKRCCAERDTRAAPLLSLTDGAATGTMGRMALDATRRSVPWQADLSPLPAGIASEPDARPAALVLATDDCIISVELLAHPPSTADEVAELVGDAIAAQVLLGSMPPSRVTVRHAEVARALASHMKPIGVTHVDDANSLPYLDEFLEGLRSHATGISEPIGAISHPDMWAAWRIPREVLERLFNAAASFYIAAPWTAIGGDNPLEVTTPRGTTWFASVLGQEGEAFGLSLFENLVDFDALYQAQNPLEAFAKQRHAVIALGFDPRAELPKSMRSELAKSGLSIAGPAAYPWLWTRNTVGGGISPDQTDDLIATLGAITSLVSGGDGAEALSAALSHAGRPFEWQDPLSGTVIQSDGFNGEFPPLWEPPLRLATALPEGERADPRAVSEEHGSGAELQSDGQLLARYVAATGHGGAQEGRAKRDESFAAEFTRAMHQSQSIPLRAVTELDLRIFLYDLFPRVVPASVGEMRDLRSSLRRFFAYLATEEGISYPWAKPILRDRATFEIRWDTSPQGHFDEGMLLEWMAELMGDLHARVLTPEFGVGVVGSGGMDMKPRELALLVELQRHWLVWRDEVIRSGLTSPDTVREVLRGRRLEWERRPQAALRGKSPADVVGRKRTRR